MFRHLFRTARRKAPATHPVSFRPRVEALEDRLVPSGSGPTDTGLVGTDSSDNPAQMPTATCDPCLTQLNGMAPPLTISYGTIHSDGSSTATTFAPPAGLAAQALATLLADVTGPTTFAPLAAPNLAALSGPGMAMADGTAPAPAPAGNNGAGQAGSKNTQTPPLLVPAAPADGGRGLLGDTRQLVPVQAAGAGDPVAAGNVAASATQPGASPAASAPATAVGQAPADATAADPGAAAPSSPAVRPLPTDSGASTADPRPATYMSADTSPPRLPPAPELLAPAPWDNITNQPPLNTSTRTDYSFVQGSWGPLSAQVTWDSAGQVYLAGGLGKTESLVPYLNVGTGRINQDNAPTAEQLKGFLDGVSTTVPLGFGGVTWSPGAGPDVAHTATEQYMLPTVGGGGSYALTARDAAAKAWDLFLTALAYKGEAAARGLSFEDATLATAPPLSMTDPVPPLVQQPVLDFSFGSPAWQVGRPGGASDLRGQAPSPATSSTLLDGTPNAGNDAAGLFGAGGPGWDLLPNWVPAPQTEAPPFRAPEIPVSDAWAPVDLPPPPQRDLPPLTAPQLPPRHEEVAPPESAPVEAGPAPVDFSGGD